MCVQIEKIVFLKQMDARYDVGDNSDDDRYDRWKVMLAMIIMMVLMMLMMVKVLTLNNHMGLFVMFLSWLLLMSLRNVKRLGCGPSNAGKWYVSDRTLATAYIVKRARRILATGYVW